MDETLSVGVVSAQIYRGKFHFLGERNTETHGGVSCYVHREGEEGARGLGETVFKTPGKQT